MYRRIRIGVIGAARADDRALTQAEEVGRLIAQRGAVLVCGGLGGVMSAAAKGCYEAGGEVVGILPGDDAQAANPYVTLPIVTAMGHARNVIIAQTAQALIAVSGEYGTLAEIAIALKLGRPVACLNSWNTVSAELVLCDSAAAAVDAMFAALSAGEAE